MSCMTGRHDLFGALLYSFGLSEAVTGHPQDLDGQTLNNWKGVLCSMMQIRDVVSKREADRALRTDLRRNLRPGAQMHLNDSGHVEAYRPKLTRRAKVYRYLASIHSHAILVLGAEIPPTPVIPGKDATE